VTNSTVANPKFSEFISSFSRFSKIGLGESLSLKTKQDFLLSGVSGLILGFSVAVALGLNTATAFFAGFLVAYSVLISGSVTSYLIIQSILLSVLAGISSLTFLVIPKASVHAETFFVGYLSIILAGSLVSLMPKIRLSAAHVAIPRAIEFAAVIFFAILVQFLRTRMPLDPVFALTRIYNAEDNAGVVSVLASSLSDGYASHVSLFGEFINGGYLAAAQGISWFGAVDGTGLLPALTHFNMTLLFMAWIPIAVLISLALSGKRFSTANSIFVILIMSLTLVLLLWPFVSIGHTSVISSAMMAMVLLALTLNVNLALKHPFVFASIAVASSYMLGTTWFPWIPLATAVATLSLVSLIQAHRDNSKTVRGLLAYLIVLAVLFVGPLISLLFETGNYIQLQGGTRSASHTLSIIWIAAIALVVLIPSTCSTTRKSVLSNLFKLVLLALVISNLYLIYTGLESNSGALGYGATKYLLTSICFSLPIIWLVFFSSMRVKDLFSLLTTGLILLCLILMAQPDSRKSPATILIPSSDSFSFLSPNPEGSNEFVNPAVVSAIQQAIELDPEQVFCVSDYGFPVSGEGVNLDSYLCTRWAQSLIGDESALDWRLVPIDRAPQSTLVSFLKSFEDKPVVIIRFTNPNLEVDSIPQVEETWWGEFIDDSWKIINVR